jgi:hypothetical protein
MVPYPEPKSRWTEPLHKVFKRLKEEDLSLALKVLSVGLSSIRQRHSSATQSSSTRARSENTLFSGYNLTGIH